MTEPDMHNATVEISTEWGLRFPNGQIAWNEARLGGASGRTYTFERTVERKELERVVKDDAVRRNEFPDQVWGRHQWVTRQVTVIRTGPVVPND